MKMSQIVEEACREASIYRDAGIVSYLTLCEILMNLSPGKPVIIFYQS